MYNSQKLNGANPERNWNYIIIIGRIQQKAKVTIFILGLQAFYMYW